MVNNNRRTQLDRLIVEKALNDTQLRSEIVRDPGVIIERGMDTAIPSSIAVRIPEEVPYKVCIVLPAMAETREDGELTETELQTVSGSFDWSLGTDCGYCMNACAPP
jgi:hypothetical protein